MWLADYGGTRRGCRCAAETDGCRSAVGTEVDRGGSSGDEAGRTEQAGGGIRSQGRPAGGEPAETMIQRGVVG